MSLRRVKRLRDEICESAKHRYHYEGDDHLYPDFVSSVVAGHVWRGNPPWCVVIGPPGGGKTDLLLCLQGHADVSMVSKISAKSLVSGWRGDDQSLLPLLDGRFLIMKDFTAMLQMEQRARDDIIGQLRDAYDGQAGGGFGIGGKESGFKEFKAHFTVIAACTPIYEHYYSVNQQLGERFVIYRFRHIDPEKAARKALANRKRGSVRRDTITKLMHKYITEVQKSAPAEADMRIAKRHEETILRLAALVCRARTHVHRDGRSKAVQSGVETEVPTRFAIQLQKIAMGSALSHGRMHVTSTDMALVTRCAGDSIPSIRYNLIRNMFKLKRTRMINYPKTPHMHACDAKQMARLQHVSRTTMARQLEDLYLCGILEEHRTHSGSSPTYSLAKPHYKVVMRTKLHLSGIRNTWQSNGKSHSKKDTKHASKKSS